MNKLLKRQIKKYLQHISEKDLAEMDIFFDAIEDAYEGFDNDRILMERSLEISSQELLERNKKLQEESKIQKQVLKNLEISFREFVPNMSDVIFNNNSEMPQNIMSLTESLKEMIHESKKNEEKIIRQAQEIKARKEDLEKFKQAADCLEDQVVFTDPEGIIIYANKKVENITGFKFKNILGKKAGTKKLWGHIMKDKFYQKLWKTIKIKKKPFIGEMKNKRKDGSIYTVEIKISPVLDKEKNILFFVAISRDITKAKEVDRLKSEFISIASHQLRTPLSSLKWVLEMLLDESLGTLNEKQKKLMIQCTDSNERMIDLVNDLLNVSRIEMGTLTLTPESVDLKSVTDSLILELTPLVQEKSQNLSFKFSKNLSKVFVDASYVRQIILNFISNAIKYTPKKGKIKIQLTERKQEVLFEVIDNGLGIPVAEQKNIFKKFYRATNVSGSNVEGSGLGLYIVKSVIEKSGGETGFESEEGQGTTFYFTLPKKNISQKIKNPLNPL